MSNDYPAPTNFRPDLLSLRLPQLVYQSFLHDSLFCVLSDLKNEYIVVFKSEILHFEHYIACIALAERLAYPEGCEQEMYRSLKALLTSLIPEDKALALSVSKIVGRNVQVVGMEYINDTLEVQPISVEEHSLSKVQISKHDFTLLGKKIDAYVPKNASPYAWEIEFKLTPENLKTLNPIPYFVGLFNGSVLFSENSSLLATLLSELYSNSLEHGVLKIDSAKKKSPEGMVQYYEAREKYLSSLEDGYIVMKLTNEFDAHKTGALRISIQDSGEGFNHKKTMSSLRPSQNYYGRGFSLIEQICGPIQFDKNGAKVTATYSYPS